MSYGNELSINTQNLRSEVQKEWVKKRKKEWYKTHKEEVKKKLKIWYRTHKEEVKARKKLWMKRNPNKVKAQKRAYRKTHPYTEKERAQKKAYAEIHKEELKVQVKTYREAHPDKVKARTKARNASRREMGYEPLNTWFPGCHGHHICDPYVIHIPEELHVRYIGHNHNKPETMIDVNKAAWAFFESQNEGQTKIVPRMRSDFEILKLKTTAPCSQIPRPACMV